MKDKNDLQKRIVQNWQLYLFILLPFIYLIMFKYVPMYGIQIAFKKFDPVKGIAGSPWVGFQNFTQFFTSYQFERVIKNTITLSFYSLISGFPMPVLLALCLNALRSAKYRKVVQMITYIPHFIAVVVMVSILRQVFNPVIGLFGILYQFLTGSTAPDLFGSAKAFAHLYVWSGVWQGMGWGTIVYIAALSNVDQELHEAAEIDGASRFKRVIHVDFPAIVPTIVIMLILRSGNIMSVGFEKAYLMQNNLNLNASEVISTYVYKVGLGAGNANFSYGAAIGLFNSVVNLMMITLVNYISNKVGETSLW